MTTDIDTRLSRDQYVKKQFLSHTEFVSKLDNFSTCAANFKLLFYFWTSCADNSFCPPVLGP